MRDPDALMAQRPPDSVDEDTGELIYRLPQVHVYVRAFNGEITAVTLHPRSFYRLTPDFVTELLAWLEVE